MTYTQSETQEIAQMTRRLDELGYAVTLKARVQDIKVDLKISPLEFWRRGRYWRASSPQVQEAIRVKLAVGLVKELLKRNAIIIERHRASPITLSLTGHLKVIFPDTLKHLLLHLKAEKVA